MSSMLKEPGGIATCLPKTPHKSRDNPENHSHKLRPAAQHCVERLQPNGIQVTLAVIV
jgi:hypothetical protein